MASAPPIYSMYDLESITGIPSRRIRFWIQKGVIPGSLVRGGIGPWYSDDHVRAIRQVVEIREQQVTLEDLSERFGGSDMER